MCEFWAHFPAHYTSPSTWTVISLAVCPPPVQISVCACNHCLHFLCTLTVPKPNDQPSLDTDIPCCSNHPLPGDRQFLEPNTGSHPGMPALTWWLVGVRKGNMNPAPRSLLTCQTSTSRGSRLTGDTSLSCETCGAWGALHAWGTHSSCRGNTLEKHG